jgi:hypothetical protein
MEDKVFALKAIIDKYNCEVRLKYKIGGYSSWNNYVIFPEKGYVEIDYPVSLSEIDCLEINTVRKKEIGRLIGEEQKSFYNQISFELNQHSILFTIQDNTIAIAL